jgi:hypothetical protein
LDSPFVRSGVPIGPDTIDMVSTDLPPTLTLGVTVELHVRFKTPTRVMVPPAAVFCHVTAGVKPLVLKRQTPQRPHAIYGGPSVTLCDISEPSLTLVNLL